MSLRNWTYRTYGSICTKHMVLVGTGSLVLVGSGPLVLVGPGLLVFVTEGRSQWWALSRCIPLKATFQMDKSFSFAVEFGSVKELLSTWVHFPRTERLQDIHRRSTYWHLCSYLGRTYFLLLSFIYFLFSKIIYLLFFASLIHVHNKYLVSLWSVPCLVCPCSSTEPLNKCLPLFTSLLCVSHFV